MKRSCVIPGKMYPGPILAVGDLKGANVGIALQRQLDLVEALQEAGAAARVDLEAMDFSGRRRHGLLLQIDRDAPRPLALLDFHREAIDDLLVDHDREDSVLEAVGEEDVAKARADDC